MAVGVVGTIFDAEVDAAVDAEVDADVDAEVGQVLKHTVDAEVDGDHTTNFDCNGEPSDEGVSKDDLEFKEK